MKERFRWRMQSTRTGWGVEAPGDAGGKKELLKLRKKHNEKFKWCRIYLMEQMVPSVIEYYKPFRLTSGKIFNIF